MSRDRSRSVCHISLDIKILDVDIIDVVLSRCRDEWRLWNGRRRHPGIGGNRPRVGTGAGPAAHSGRAGELRNRLRRNSSAATGGSATAGRLPAGTARGPAHPGVHPDVAVGAVVVEDRGARHAQRRRVLPAAVRGRVSAARRAGRDHRGAPAPDRRGYGSSVAEDPYPRVRFWSPPRWSRPVSHC